MTEADKYEVLEEIGRGSFGIIRKVRRKSDGHVLCRKEISYRKMQTKEREQLHAELSILKDLRHPNIVAYYEREHLKASFDLHLYMEYCGNGDLGRVIQNLKAKNQSAPEDFVWNIFSQLVSALYRCHYGQDPPDAARDGTGQANDALPLKNKADYTVILHRDLKPENVFLDADNSVKLGDFGLSKLVQSNALFAQTYVGTPYYMSPEIYNNEKYSRASDVWGLACVIYELCAKEPPFNAQTIQQLTQKITSGNVKPLGRPYSLELQQVLTSCLKVNQHMRPTIADLLNHPMVKLSRKQTELARQARQVKIDKEKADKKMEEANEKILGFEVEKQIIKQDIEASLRREWEVKARLEIDRQVQIEAERLRKLFEVEVNKRVAEEVQRQIAAMEQSTQPPTAAPASPPRSSTPTMEISQAPKASFSTVNTEASTDFPSSTDLSELSLHESPLQQRQRQPMKRSTRTPFARARTMFEGSPMDVHMASPSPATVASLNLSPRRTSGAGILTSTSGNERAGNIFAAANANTHATNRWEVTNAYEDGDDEGDADEVPDLPSPTVVKEMDPFKTLAGGQPTRRPGLLRQKTAPIGRLNSRPSLFANAVPTRPTTQPPTFDNPAPTASATSTATTLAGSAEQRPNPPALPPKSPSRRLSKLPSATGAALTGGVVGTYDGSPVRKAPPPPVSLAGKGGAKGKGEEMIKQVMRNNFTTGLGLQGRTLVELSQGRAPGERSPERPGAKSLERGISRLDFALAGKNNEDVENRGRGGIGGGGMMGMKFAARLAGGGRGGEKDGGGVTVWDPERDEMPSPFLVRGGRGILGRLGR